MATKHIFHGRDFAYALVRPQDPPDKLTFYKRNGSRFAAENVFRSNVIFVPQLESGMNGLLIEYNSAPFGVIITGYQLLKIFELIETHQLRWVNELPKQDYWLLDEKERQEPYICEVIMSTCEDKKRVFHELGNFMSKGHS